MGIKNKYVFTAVLLCLVSLCAVLFTVICNGSSKQREKAPLIVTSFYPVYIAAANVIGDCEEVKLQNLSEPQTGCLHDFQLTTEDMKLLSNAEIFLVNGGGMESFLTDVAEQYPHLTITETAEDAGFLSENAHVFMSVPRYRSQVAAITDSLCRQFPKQEEEFRKNALAYDKKLSELQTQQEELKTAIAGKKIVSLHDAFEYVANDYGLIVSYRINLDEERQTSAGEAADLLSAILKKGAQTAFVEELYGRDLAKLAQKETGIGICYLDSLTRGDGSLDSYIDGMQENISRLKKAFGE